MATDRGSHSKAFINGQAMYEISEKLRKAHNLAEGWRPFRLESLGSKRTHVRIDGAVFPTLLKSGPRKGKINYKKPQPGTEAIIVVSNAEYDEWMAEVRRKPAAA